MMKILIVEPDVTRRAELVDWTCELPGFVVIDAVAGLAEAHALLATTTIDVIVLGAVPRTLARLAPPIVEARDTMDELAAALAAHRESRMASRTASAVRAVYMKRLEYEREARDASLQTLQYRLRAEPHVELAKTIDLREWIPRLIAKLRAVVPPHIELVAMVAVDTLPVRCLMTELEHVISDAVLRACEHLPWGGTVWLTAAPGADGEVTLDVLEDGRGEIRDVRLRASVPAVS